MKKITAIVPFLLIALLVLLPLQGEAQSISRGKKKPATTTTTKKKNQTSTKRTSSKTKTNSSANVINVSSTEQFLDALGSNKTIVIQKSINLSSVLDHELELVGYKNLTIKGVNPSIKFEVTRGDHDVLDFASCENISISNLIFGHESAGCYAAVLVFNECKGVTISSCDIYGCGYKGIVIEKSDNFLCTNSNIHDCWTELLEISQSKNITFKNSIIKDSGCGTLMYVSSSDQVKFEKCTFTQTKGAITDWWTCFKLNCYISLVNCTIRSKNTYLGDTQYIKQSGCKWY